MRHRRRNHDCHHHLPPAAATRRWGPRAKAAVVTALRQERLSHSEACDRYSLSLEELAGWEAAFDRDGVAGLQASALATRHRPKREVLRQL
jgi:uncharacterized protein DUF1153